MQAALQREVAEQHCKDLSAALQKAAALLGAEHEAELQE